MTTGGSATERVDGERTFFDAFGFLVIRGLLTTDIDSITDAFEAVYADPSNPRIPLTYPGEREQTRVAMPGLVERHPLLAGLPTDPRVLGVVEHLLGPDPTYVGSDGSIHLGETDWHYDAPVCQPDRRHLKVAVYLDPLRGPTGAPRLVPCSHQLPAVEEGPLEPFLAYDGQAEERTGWRGEALPHWSLDTDPGDVVIWDFRIVHASFGGTEPRRQFSMNFHSARPVAADLTRLGAERAAAIEADLGRVGLTTIGTDELARLRRESRSYRRFARMDDDTADG